MKRATHLTIIGTILVVLLLLVFLSSTNAFLTNSIQPATATATAARSACYVHNNYYRRRNTIHSISQPRNKVHVPSSYATTSSTRRKRSLLQASLEDDAADADAAFRIKAIRSTLENANTWKKFRISTGLIPEIDNNTGKRIQSDSKFIVAISAALVTVIGIFASQLAGDSWDSIKAEVQADKRRNRHRKMQGKGGCKVITSLFGYKLPDGLITDQVEMKQAGSSMEELIEAEYMNMAAVESQSTGKATLYEHRVLIPALLNAFFTYSDPVVYGQGRTKGQDDYNYSSNSNNYKYNNNIVFQHLEATRNITFDAGLAMSVIRELWYLPVLSILSGFTPASRIIAESHLSRLPDTPIAHDIDTFQLWPAIGNAADGNLPPTMFQTPAAAITDESQYNVDWNAVSNAFFTNVGTSLVYSGVLALALYFYLYSGKSLMSSSSIDTGSEE